MRFVGLASVLAAVAIAGCGGNGSSLTAGGDGGGGAGSVGPGGKRGGGGGVLTGTDGGMAAVGGSGGTSGGPTDGPAPTPDMAVREAGPPDSPSVTVDGPTAREAGPPDVAAREAAPPDTTNDLCAAGGLCSMYEQSYTDAFNKAKVCTPTSPDQQCQELRQTGLACGCHAWVNVATDLDAIRKKWMDTGCDKCVRACPAILCIATTSGACSPMTSTCVNQPKAVP